VSTVDKEGLRGMKEFFYVKGTLFVATHTLLTRSGLALGGEYIAWSYVETMPVLG
jgi:hypothetical protein